jgi:zinc-ribbon domain
MPSREMVVGMFCTRCGSENSEGSRFCARCGAPIVTAPAAAPVSEPVTDAPAGAAVNPGPAASATRLHHPPTPTLPVPAPTRGRFARNMWAIVVSAALFLVGILIGASGGSSSSTSAPTATRSQTVTQTETTASVQTVTKTVKVKPPGPKIAFGDGVFLVGSEIRPGTYRAPGGSGCYWERDRDLTGGLNSILANGNPSGQTIVTILSTDKAFQSNGCGGWRRV